MQWDKFNVVKKDDDNSDENMTKIFFYIFVLAWLSNIFG